MKMFTLLDTFPNILPNSQESQNLRSFRGGRFNEDAPLGEEERDAAGVGQERRPVTARSGRDEMYRVRRVRQRRVTCAAAAPRRRTCIGVFLRWPLGAGARAAAERTKRKIGQG
jgi:hypothetical protein